MIGRERHRTELLARVEHSPVVAILGARQVGKTTLARDIMARVPGPAVRFDLEDPDDLARLDEPKLALGRIEGLVVIDEIQRRPELFPVLRVLADRPGTRTRFLVLGSASPELLRQTAETLAGRVVFHPLGGFVLDEIVTRLGCHPEEAHFWATHAGAELDLLVVRGNRRIGFEIKRTTAPRTERSMWSAIESLRLDRLDVVHAGEETFPMRGGIRALACRRLLDDLDPL